MRVVVIGRSSALGSFASAIAMAFTDLGHEASTHEFRMMGESFNGRLANVARGAGENIVGRSPQAVRALYRSRLKEIHQAQPDLILTTLGRVTREEVDAWREMAPGAPVVLWFPDALSNFGRQQSFLAGFDRIFVKDPYLVDRLAIRGGFREVRYLPEGAPPDVVAWAKLNATPHRTRAMVMAGNIYPTRVRFLESIIDDLDLDIYGRLHNDSVPDEIASRFTGRYLAGEEKYQVFRDARGVLNNLHYAEVGSVNYRLFEAAACRGVAVVDDVPQVRRYFEPGSEVITFGSPRELLSTMKEITDKELASIGDAAHDRTVREHLVTHRISEMLDDLALR